MMTGFLILFPFCSDTPWFHRTGKRKHQNHLKKEHAKECFFVWTSVDNNIFGVGAVPVRGFFDFQIFVCGGGGREKFSGGPPKKFA